jgi:ABC-type amino acid transport substrate-binding protein
VLQGTAAISYPFLLDVSDIVELVDAPSPAAPLPVRPEPRTQLQSVSAGTLGLVHANATDSRVTVTSQPVASPSSDDALIWTGTGLALAASMNGARLVTLQAQASESLTREQISLLLYRGDAQGRPLAPDGVSLAASAQAAVIAQIGCVPDDAGRTLFASGSTSLLLQAGQQLCALLSRRNAPLQTLVPLEVSADGQGLRLQLGPNESPELVIQASLALSEVVDLQLEIAGRIGLNGLLFLNDGEQVTIDLLSSCGLTNTLGFVKVDIDSSDPAQPHLSVAGQPISNDDAFRQVVVDNLDPGLRVSQGGNTRSSHLWTVSSGTGFYSPVMISGLGEVYALGKAINRDKEVHLKGIGDGAYVFEDLSADQGGDFDYNDAVIRLIRTNATVTTGGDVVLASGSGSFELAGATNALLGDTQGQVVRTSGLQANQIQLTGGGDTVLRQGLQPDSIFMGADDDVLVLGRQGGGGTMRLGADRDRLIIGAGTLTSNGGSPDRITDFDPADDRILVVGNAALTLLDSPSGLVVHLDGQPVLMLEGIHDRQRLDAAISLERQSPGDRIDHMVQRGVLTVALPADRPGLSQRSADGIWSGYAVDLVRALAAQLVGNPGLVLFAEPVGDAERLTSLRNGHIDLALLDGDSLTADLAGDGDRSWTLPAAGPSGPLTFLLPENQTRFRQTIDRLLQTPLQALRLGLNSSNLPSADAPELTTAVRRFLDLTASASSSTPDSAPSSDAGAGLPLQQGFVRQVLNRLGNDSQLWQRFFGAETPAISTLDPAAAPLDLPLEGPPLQPPAHTPRQDDALATLLKRGELRLAVAVDRSGQPHLSAPQQRQLQQLAALLGSEASPLPMRFVPMYSASEGLGLLVTGAVDLLVPDAFSTLWLDGVVGVDSVAGDDDDPAVLLVTRSSGIQSDGDLGGSRLGLSGGHRVAAALGKQLSQAGVQASLLSFANSEEALRALQLGRLEGVVLRRSVVSDAQRQLENLGIATQPLPNPVHAGSNQLLVAADQSRLRDRLQALMIMLRTTKTTPSTITMSPDVLSLSGPPA